MQYSSQAFSDADPTTAQAHCAFCQLTAIAQYILKETPAFRIVADHAPLVEGHLLIVPKQHYACYGDVPAGLDAELLALKQEVRAFFQQYYAPAAFWEHGVFHQTVFHAHMHAFPFGDLSPEQYAVCDQLKAATARSQDDVRAWYASHGYYFYLEGSQAAFLFAPDMDRYSRIIREVLLPGASRAGLRTLRSPAHRQEEGRPAIASLTEKWHQFQREKR